MNKIRLLLIDEDPSTCLAVKAGLGGEFEVILDEGGVNLPERIRHLRPQIILLDINLPGVNGFRLLESLHPFLDEIKVFVISLRAGEDDILTAFHLGACDYLTKPFSTFKQLRTFRCSDSRELVILTE